MTGFRFLWLLAAALVGASSSVAFAQAPTATTFLSGLTAAGALSDTDTFAICQNSAGCDGTAGKVILAGTNTQLKTYLAAGGGGFLTKANNLSDLASASNARTNLGFTFSGNTLKLTTFGAGGFTSGHQLVFDGSGNAVDGGAPGSGGTVTSITCGTGLSGGTITTTGTCSMPNTGPGVVSVTNANITLDAQGRVTAAANGSGGGGGNFFTSTAATTGPATAYVLGMAGYTANVGNFVCAGGGINVASGANPTLNVQATGAKPIKLFSLTGLLPLSGNELQPGQQVCWTYDGTNYVVQSPLSLTPSPIAVTTVMTAAQWNACQPFSIITAGQTITVPAAGPSLPTGGCADISTVGVTAQVCPAGGSGDSINVNQVGGSASPGACITWPADWTAKVTTSGSSGTTAFTAPLGPVQYFTLAWGEGLNLSTNARGLSRFSTPKVIYGIKCNVQAASGSAGTIHLFSTASGTAPASGTALDTTGCNSNAASNTEQDMGVASAGVGTTVAGYTIWGVSASTGTSGNGLITISYR